VLAVQEAPHANPFSLKHLTREVAAMMSEMISEPIEVLLVEDNEDDIVLIEEAFAEAKLMNVIFKVRDGEDALAYLRQAGPYTHSRRPGLVLLDINMPRMNGFEVLRAMKADSLLQSLPVMMLTTSDREDDIVRSYADGACSYIRKPMSLEQFVQVVKDFELYWTMVSRVPPTSR
jgi:CheY-like chemotaxis protein